MKTELLDQGLTVMLFSVHLQRSAVVAIINFPVRDQFIASRPLKPVAPQWI
jgi:hypothetical protein